MYIVAGRWETGEVIYNFDGQYIRQGRWSTGDILYTIKY